MYILAAILMGIGLAGVLAGLCFKHKLAIIILGVIVLLATGMFIYEGTSPVETTFSYIRTTDPSMYGVKVAKTTDQIVLIR